MSLKRLHAARARVAQSHSSRARDIDALSPAVSRRQFVRTTAGAVAAGAVVGSGLWRPSSSLARAVASSDPVPIPGGTPVLGGAFHIYGPAAIDPVDAEPSTISDFNGFVGLAYISGAVTRRRRSTGQIDVLPFLDADMRFMQGVYRAQDGRVRRGTFALI